MIIISRLEMAIKWGIRYRGISDFSQPSQEMSEKGVRLKGRSPLHPLLLDEAIDAIFKLGTLHVQHLRPWMWLSCLAMAT